MPLSKPDSLATFTRNCRQPASDNSAAAAPAATFTRISGLMFTPNKQRASRSSCNFAVASAASGNSIAAASARFSASENGAPK